MDFLFNLVSKLVWFLVDPANWIFFLLVLAFLAARTGDIRRAKRWLATTLVYFLALTVLPVGDIAMRSLETRFPVNPKLEDIYGIIVLGGGEDIHATELFDQVNLGPAGERVTMGAVLARANPGTKLLYTGGTGALSDIGNPRSGAAVAGRLYEELGLEDTEIILEHAARNTSENARLSADLVDETQRWVLVTSAFHMARSVSTFERAGWTDLVPYPVDFQVTTLEYGGGYHGQINALRIAVREYIGLLAYRLAGR